MAEPLSPAPAHGRAVRVFVSSTFRDMHAEREELVKRVFPQLRKLCERRGVTWGDVDLRWGITEEQAAQGEVLPRCLEEIHRCRPYFIGLLGERYGWVPPEIPADLIEREPWLSQHLEHSITELEILHGVLTNPQMAQHGTFYFRDPAYVDGLPAGQRAAYREGPSPQDIERLGREVAENRAEERRQNLAALKERIRTSGFPVREDFHDAQELGQLVLRDMTAVIDRLYPEGSQPHPLVREALEHESFAASRTGVYIGRQAYFDRLDAHATSGGPPLVVLGPSGAGKSALLANWSARYRATHLVHLVHVHFIGATPTSVDWAAMVRRVVAELQRHFAIGGAIPDEPAALRAAFANVLHLAAAKGRAVLVLDGLDQLEDRDAALDLVWLPPQIPNNVRLVLSTLPGRPFDELRKRAWPTLEVEPLEPGERNQLIREVLTQYAKSLSPARAERIAVAPQTANPLYLRTLLEELRVFGVHEELDRRIDFYLTAPSPRALYQRVFERYEADYERERPGLVGEAMRLLWAARRGLSEAELLDLLGSEGEPLPRAYWSPLYLAAEPSLVVRSGLIGFFHDYARQAVAERYLPDQQAQRGAHLRLAEYFKARGLSQRQIDELPWQLARAGSWERLYALLACLPFFDRAWDADPFEVKAYWAQTEANSPLRMVEAYGPAIRAPDEYASYAWKLATLLHDTGHPTEAVRLRRFLVDQHRRDGNSLDLAGALGNLAAVLQDLGDLDEAMALLREEERSCGELGYTDRLASALGNQALILRDWGDLDGAIALHREEERICRELGDTDGIARSLGNQGTILATRGDLDGAQALYLQQERICRELGNRAGLASAIGNQGTVSLRSGDLTRAEALFSEQEHICRDLGDRDGTARALGNQGIIRKMQGDISGALALQREVERLFRDLGDKDGLAGALGNQALLLRARGELDAAMALLEEQERLCRELGGLDELQRCLGNQALVLTDRGRLAEGMALLKEQERICRELDSKEGLQRALGNRANILTAVGDLNGALALHEEKERICRALGEPKGLGISLANQASILARMGRRREALSRAQEAYRTLTAHGLTRVAGQILPILQDIQSQPG